MGGLADFLFDKEFAETVERRAAEVREVSIEISQKEVNPRYAAFLKVDNGPEKGRNLRYMDFIMMMKTRYAQAFGRVFQGVDGHISIVDHDEFTSFIEELVKQDLV